MIVNEKEALERGAVTQFCRLYADERLGQIEFCSLLNPPKSDALCKKDGEDLFIEVGHFYGTESDAKKRLGRTGQSAPTEEEQHISRMMPFKHRVLARLNDLLKSKSAKTYEVSPVWLLVRNGFPALDKSDFLRDLDNIVVPENHSFEEIWLLCCPYIGGLIKLY